MSFEILEEKTNPVVGRREAKMLVHHEGAGTPDRLTVRKLASDHFKTSFDRVYVRSISTRTGGSSALCAVEVYEDAASAKNFVPAYIKNRNLPKAERVSKQKKPEEAKPAAPPPQKKAEAKAPPKVEPKPSVKPEPSKESKPEQAKPAKTETKAKP
jgi:ribosomal protein S24E